MSLRRCCSLLSTARPVGRIATDLTARLMSRANRDLGRRSSRANDRAPVTVAVEPPDPIASSHRAGTDNGGGYVAIPSRRNANVFSSVSATPRPEIIADSRDDDDDDYLDDRDVTLPKALDRCIEDVSDVGPHLTPTFTFAKYANESRTIQELVKLGVGLYKFETQEDMVQYILGLDFDHDVKPYIRFLHDCGVPADQLGHFITKNPNIFKEDMDDLHTRIRYLRAHQFSVQMISAIICKNPNWLMFSTKDIDGRLGYFQSNFALNGGEVRLLSIKGPKVITYRMVHLFENTFSVKEEMGFDKRQSKQLLLRLPRLWTKSKYARETDRPRWDDRS